MLHRFLMVKFIFFIVACHAEIALPTPKKGELTLPTKEKIQVEIALTQQEHSKGLSGRKKESFTKSMGMLFWYQSSGMRQFWMPDTYFNLDIFFLDKNLKVSAIERNMPAHPGTKVPPKISATKRHRAHYVLEMRSDSPLAKKITVGTTLKWTGSSSLSEIK